MAKRKKKTRRISLLPAAPAPARSAAARAILKEQTERRERNRAAWAVRHKRLAAEERTIRKAIACDHEQFKHKAHGTVQTHAHAARTRQGALARLFQTEAINGEQLQAGADIASAAERIMQDVAVRTANHEGRVDRSRHGDAFWEALGSVWLEAAYSDWRRSVGSAAPLVLAIVVDDLALTAAAARHHMSARRARAMLVDALDRWIAIFAATRKAIDPAALLAAQAAVL